MIKTIYKSFLVLCTATFMLSCTAEKKGDPTRFKYGTFEIPAGDNYGKTVIIRKDSLQIESYTKNVSISTDSTVTEKEELHIDTLYIKWKNNFAYTLRMKSPKTDLDKDPIFVQITKVADSSYNFTARIGYSNFKQKGTVYKVK
ncbi:hypothetical protein [uncultured Tenacibaculum sp.]|uniref:hypothetical protein n=1 Tax=uncultured Tenacibaculum sp. TaxID=174713 RepID=UPI0026232D4D|nr:hypothetical protein [uncultured Tenacibaculum sp.]